MMRRKKREKKGGLTRGRSCGMMTVIAMTANEEPTARCFPGWGIGHR